MMLSAARASVRPALLRGHDGPLEEATAAAGCCHVVKPSFHDTQPVRASVTVPQPEALRTVKKQTKKTFVLKAKASVNSLLLIDRGIVTQNMCCIPEGTHDYIYM